MRQRRNFQRIFAPGQAIYHWKITNTREMANGMAHHFVARMS